MRIGIDAIVLRGRDAGTLRYVEQLLSGFASGGSLNDYLVFLDQRILPSGNFPATETLHYRHVSPIKTLPRAIQQQFFRGWNDCGAIDLLHCPAFVPPLSFDGRTVTTIFDLTFYLYPGTMKWTGRLWWQIFGRKGIQRADRIIALSESTKKDLCRCFNVYEGKVKVIYPCTRDIFKPSVNSKEVAVKYRLPDKYILYVGTLERRKNITNLIRVFSMARHIGSIEHILVLAGQRGWLYQDIFETVEELGLTNQVIFLDHVPEDDLPALYSGADLFVYLSRYEGFGLPVLEAMACGVPVLTSDTSSLPEVVEKAGVLVPPDDVERAASEMVRILSDRDLRRQMIEQGLQRASYFSSERMMRQTLAVYDELNPNPG
jgi:glycosyltransferase involved in cell wall biosynthesis